MSPPHMIKQEGRSMDTKRHTLTLDARASLAITAVDDVVSFDETLVSLAVGESTLNISGEGLSIKSLSLENGDITVEGNISAIVYFDSTVRKRKNRLFGRG